MKQLGAPSVFSFVFRGEKLPLVRSKRDGSSRKTRRTYNCAHLRSTKESLTFRYFDTGRCILVGTWSV